MATEDLADVPSATLVVGLLDQTMPTFLEAQPADDEQVADRLLAAPPWPTTKPVDTVGIGGGRSAGLLAVRILGASDEWLRTAMSRIAIDSGRPGGGTAAAADHRLTERSWA